MAEELSREEERTGWRQRVWEIVFEAGNHHEAMRLQYEDFVRLVKPTVADFAVR